MFCLTGANVDDRDPKVWSILGKRIYEKLFADRGSISPSLFEALFADGVNLVTGIRSNMKNKLIPLWDKIMLRKRYIIECINHLLRDKGILVHSRQRSINNFLKDIIAAISAYCSQTASLRQLKDIVLKTIDY